MSSKWSYGRKAAVDREFKVVLVGNVGVGKTSILRMLKSGIFLEDVAASSIGVDSIVRPIQLPGGNSVNLQIFDTAGMEEYRTVSVAYYRGAHAVVLVYDFTNSKSFFDLPLWCQEVSKYAPDAFVYLFGTKDDLPNQEVDSESVKNFSITYNMQKCFTISTKLNRNLNEALLAIAEDLNYEIRLDSNGRLVKSIQLHGHDTNSEEQPFASSCLC